MKPIHFPEAQRTLNRPVGMTEEECGSLAIFEDHDKLISAWQMTWRERLSALFFGRVWLWVWSGRTQPPVSLMAKKTVFTKVSDVKRYSSPTAWAKAKLARMVPPPPPPPAPRS